MAVREIISRVLLIALLIAPAACCGPVFGDEPPASLPPISRPEWMGSSRSGIVRDTPGCAVGIVHRGQVIYSKGFGSANLEYRVPNTPQTVFDVGRSPSRSPASASQC